jgi:hypothetical protein
MRIQLKRHLQLQENQRKMQNIMRNTNELRQIQQKHRKSTLKKAQPDAPGKAASPGKDKKVEEKKVEEKKAADQQEKPVDKNAPKPSAPPDNRD